MKNNASLVEISSEKILKSIENYKKSYKDTYEKAKEKHREKVIKNLIRPKRFFGLFPEITREQVESDLEKISTALEDYDEYDDFYWDVYKYEVAEETYKHFKTAAKISSSKTVFLNFEDASFIESWVD
jgi:hypothetical protein